MEQIVVPYTHRQQQPAADYLDNLLPGYRFCPTDSELILYYLKPKIQTGEHHHPRNCRIHQVDLYNHSPEQLTSWYRACDDKWYFFTSRERKYQNGKLPNRRTGKFGFWKATQKFTPVYHHDVTGSRGVGTRRSLAYHDDKSCKTSWLMQEYTVNDPNISIKSGQVGNKVLTDWVLCKIYKKKNNELDKTTIQFPHDVASASSASPVSDQIFQQNHSMSTAGFRFSNGASSSNLFEPHVRAEQLPAAYASPVISTDAPLEDICQRNRSMLMATNSFRHSQYGSSNSISDESLTDAAEQPALITSPVTLEDGRMDDLSIIPSVLNEDVLEFDFSEWISVD